MPKVKKPREDHAVVYLCGGVDKAPDGGVGWRITWADHLTKLGHVVIDPITPLGRELAKHLGWYRFDWARWSELKHEDWDAWTRACQFIADRDINDVAKCNILLVRWDKYAGSGTAGEMTLAKFLNRKVYVWLADGTSKTDLPVWITGVMGDIFETEAELLRHFKRLQGDY